MTDEDLLADSVKLSNDLFPQCWWIGSVFGEKCSRMNQTIVFLFQNYQIDIQKVMTNFYISVKIFDNNFLSR